MDLIIFDTSPFEATDPTSIIIYNSRLALPDKYSEIGTIKFEGTIDINALKKLAASKGAEALLLDGNNYILIIFISNEDSNAKNQQTI